MNYRHAFHAGNFADVVKHAVLARIVAYLKEKAGAFRVIDTHAGAGLYDLAGPEATRTDEWREGIGRLAAARLSPAASDLLAPYLDAVMAHNPSDPLEVYPGSPVLAQHWMRPQDRLVACEREPETARTLALRLRGDRRSKAVAIDGYMALNAYVPPKERRGVVLVDPPFEAPDEFERLAQAVIGACRKWPAGIYALWYPIKDTGQTEAFARGLVQAGLARILRAELTLPGRGDERLHGCGLILVNPPWRLDSELVVMLPALAEVLAGGAERGAGTRIGWLAGEK